MDKIPYKIIINTDSYTGNFERELIAYSFGRLARVGGFTAYARPFWDSVVGTGVESYERYLEINKKEHSVEDSLDCQMMKQRLVGKGMSEDVAILKIKKICESVSKKMAEENILRVYDEFLCFTNQRVDDWEEVTFYNIFCYEPNNCSAIYVQLNKPLTEYFENIIIPRIIKFFELDIYNKIQEYEYLCMFDEVNRTHNKKIKLKDLLLVDADGNVIKNYLE